MQICRYLTESQIKPVVSDYYSNTFKVNLAEVYSAVYSSMEIKNPGAVLPGERIVSNEANLLVTPQSAARLPEVQALPTLAFQPSTPAQLARANSGE